MVEAELGIEAAARVDGTVLGAGGPAPAVGAFEDDVYLAQRGLARAGRRGEGVACAGVRREGVGRGGVAWAVLLVGKRGGRWSGRARWMSRSFGRVGWVLAQMAWRRAWKMSSSLKRFGEVSMVPL